MSFGQLALIASTNAPFSWTAEGRIDTVVGTLVGPPNRDIIEYASKGTTDVSANFLNLE